MLLEDREDQQANQNKIQKERRHFLKKAALVSPAIVALGALTKPTESEAGFGKPSSGLTWS